MRPFLSLVFVIAICSCTERSKVEEVTLELSDTPTFDTCFPIGTFRFFRPANKDTIIEIGGKSYKGAIGKIVLQDSTELSDTVLVFATEDKGKPAMAVDTDNDKRFQNESLYPTNDSINIKVKNYRIEEDGKLITKEFYVTPAKSTMKVLGGKSEAYGSIGLKIKNPFKEARVLVGKDSFLILVINPFFNKKFFSAATSLIVVKASDRSLYKRADDLLLNKIGDTLYLGNYVFVAKKFDVITSSKLILGKVKYTDEEQGFLPGKILPPQSVKNIQTGKYISIGGTTSKYLVIDFWGTWCGPCTELTEEIADLYNKHKSKINIIGVAVDSDDSTVLRYMKYRNMDWPNVFDDLKIRNISKTFTVRSFPTFFLIDNSGRIMYRGIGRAGFNQIKKIINDL